MQSKTQQFNLLKFNYKLIYKYYKLCKKGLISLKVFNAKKLELLHDCEWENDYYKLKGKQLQNYNKSVFSKLLKLFKRGIITYEEFDFQCCGLKLNNVK